MPPNDLNARLARWDGWKSRPTRTGRLYWSHPDWNRGRGYEPPAYDSDRNLMTGLLGKLADEPGAKVALFYALMDRQEHRVGSWEAAWYILTLPPADLAAAIAEAVGC